MTSKPAHLSFAELRELADSANLPTLLMLIYQVTGDSRWLEPPYCPTRSRGLSDHDTGGFSEQIQDEVRLAGAHALFDLQSGNAPAIPMPNAEQTSRMLGVCVGESVDPSYGVMFSEEFERRMGIQEDVNIAESVPPGFHVLVIGAGVSGIIAAQRLGQMGIPYTVVDEHDGAGGNWRDNPYPGAGVDTPSHLYSFSFAPHDWTKHFELRPELEEYFEATFERVGGPANTRFNTKVVSARFDPDAMVWRVEVQDRQGNRDQITANAVISAVGVLNRPSLPNIDGRDRFTGPSFHSSHWPEDLDIDGKSVAVIGSGASAMQIVPAIADRVGKLTVFQRTPPWVAPFEKFQLPIDYGARYLLNHFPMYRSWYFLKLYWQFGDKVLDSLRKDPSWPHPERSVNAINDGHRRFFTEYIEEQLDSRTDLLDKVVPTYPPYGKRILLDNGWYAALLRDNVTLVTEAVCEVLDQGVRSSSGDAYEADILVWATGFQASRFVSSLDITGLSGQTLRDAWDDDDARAYLGVTVPDFPNLFLLGGPNSFPGSGSFMYFMEVQMRYIGRILASMIDANVAAVNTRQDVYERYGDLVDATSQTTVWTHPGTNTFFRNARGRLVFVSPFRNVEYWKQAVDSGLEDYDLLGNGQTEHTAVAASA
ncbi:FAD-dependent oxidoreductase [Mycobacterium sp.]|jgi:4-hydroxyacetophenone monooxygenase|uniref:FAD-dependent oxidoreductase n=1 Tax=Mycobacterium sp. TaxID=1785 RepID=UPI002CEE970C|nr:FAD-dependent oxidoreductase [Mycobacterium sp.]HXB87738.1 FAD-dependent oxidoreductase [Mycobacterium sp.]